MSSAGHVLDAINRLMYNRRQLLARRERYNELKGHFEAKLKSEGFHFKNDKIPREKLEEIKAAIRLRIRRRKRRIAFLSTTLTLAVIFILVFLAMNFIKF